MGILVFISVLLVAACGLIYELVAGTLASDLVAHVLTFDYLGAVGASLLFPILLVPRLGLVRSAMLFGLINAAVALWSTFLFANQLSCPRGLRVTCVVVLCTLGAGIACAKQITTPPEDNNYAAEIIFARY